MKLEKRYFKRNDILRFLGISQSSWYRSKIRKRLTAHYFSGPRSPFYDIHEVKQIIEDLAKE